jgi:thiamine biosynthesis lipoprotein
VTSPQAGAKPPGPLAVEERPGGLFAISFSAMACPCELLLDTTSRADALHLGTLAAAEAWRIERKYSRYLPDSVVAWVHDRRGATIVLDAETASLMDFAKQCFTLSDGLFDITSGILRRAWTFDGSDRVPQRSAVEQLLPLIGFDKLQWQSPALLLPDGMELDFGGIGKEYAVDRAYDILTTGCSMPFLLNFGGDLRANKRPSHGSWQVGVERPGTDRAAAMRLTLEHGALATSGDSHRFLLKDGIRYGHILDPRSGWPVEGSPRSVTVAASSCTEAGLLATLAMLHGAEARQFLEEQGARFWML